MIGNTSPRANLGLVIADDHAVIEIMGVGIHIGIVGNGTAFMNDDLAPIIQEHVLVNCAIIFDRQVVAKRKFHSMKYLYVLTAKFEDVTGQHCAHAEPQ